MTELVRFAFRIGDGPVEFTGDDLDWVGLGATRLMAWSPAIPEPDAMAAVEQWDEERTARGGEGSGNE